MPIEHRPRDGREAVVGLADEDLGPKEQWVGQGDLSTGLGVAGRFAQGFENRNRATRVADPHELQVDVQE